MSIMIAFLQYLYFPLAVMLNGRPPLKLLRELLK